MVHCSQNKDLVAPQIKKVIFPMRSKLLVRLGSVE